MLLTRSHSSLRAFTKNLCNNHIVIRSASLNSAVARGLRRSKSIGFRGKEKSREKFGERSLGSRQDRGDWEGSHNGQYTPGKRAPLRNSDTKPFRGKVFDSDEGGGPRKRTRRARFNDPESNFAKRSIHKPTADRPTSTGFKSPNGRRRPALTEKERRAAESDITAIERNPDGSKISTSRRSFLERTRSRGRLENFDNDGSMQSRPGSHNERQGPSHVKPRGRDSPEYSDSGDWRSRVIRDYRKDEKASPEGERFRRTEDRFSSARGSNDRERQNDERPAFRDSPDKKMPLSIPYSTPASEFLYGTSVVETALTSKKEPRRQLYKLYIHRGENGESEVRDIVIERLARKAGVEVHFVHSGWLRLMDKMSGGRPHNGYILEASPLPKLPILSLGPIASDNSQHGFSVALDFQSREEAAINGTSSFVNIPRDPSGRKPFVLLLDSIQDPGNLGGMLRTASFLGVTAVAVSTRNSASFTPVVLKASAGASEQVTLFSVNKPAGFLENSKAAGWKIYASVAPTSFPKANDRPSTTTDELGDPLLEDPCILMLGNEGEGLRWNLRSKADRDISIPGSGLRGGVDSLNVSVAAGVLCHAFLKNRQGSLPTPEKQLETFLRPKKDLF